MSSNRRKPLGAPSRRWAHLGVFLAFVLMWSSVAAIVLVPRYSKPVGVADIGTDAPDFQLHDTQGRTINLNTCLGRGQAVVLFFCNSFPTPEQDYSPRVSSLANQYGSDGRVQFLAIAAAGEEADATGRPFPTLIDDHSAVAARYSGWPKPFLIVIDPRGQVRYRGSFDDNRDLAFVTQNYCGDALREVLGAPSDAMASVRK
jgi:peroxiredoxin